MKFGEVIVEASGRAEVFADIISKLNLRPPIIVKPNWGVSQCYTEAKILDWVLSAIGDKVLVVESYGWARTKDAVFRKRMGSKSRSSLRKSDQWFLDYSGIRSVLEKHGVEYFNITEAVWAGRVVEPETIRRLVEAEYPPVHNDELYGAVPIRLYESRGGTFLSLAKLKSLASPIDVSLSVKNLFGLIPTPSRMRFHGKKNVLLDRSIVDINKIYRALFTVKGIVEGVFTASLTGEDPLDPEIHKNLGLVLGSEDTVELDAFVSSLIGKDPYQVGHLKLASELFGKWNDRNIALGRESGIRIF